VLVFRLAMSFLDSSPPSAAPHVRSSHFVSGYLCFTALDLHDQSIVIAGYWDSMQELPPRAFDRNS